MAIMKREDAEKICRQFGNDPKEMLSGFKAFADSDYDAMMPGVSTDGELIEPVLEVPVATESSNEDSLIERLKTFSEAEETSKTDKKTAEELIARLEEVKAAKTNAEEFLQEKVVVVEPKVEVGVEVKPAVPAPTV